jgi:hypothetical protein
MQQQLVFTADDFGLDARTNLAIESAHRFGALTAASLMLGQPGSAHAIEVARRNPDLHAGWHVHLCDSVPLTRPRWPWGGSPPLAGLTLAVWPPARALVWRELRAQWQRFLDTGLHCHFINGHHHLHIHPLISRDLYRLVGTTFSGWVRGFDAHGFGPAPLRCWIPGLLRRPAARWLGSWPEHRRTTSLWGLDRTFRMNAREVRNVLPTLAGGRHEFLFHPRCEGDTDHRALLELGRQVTG